MTIKSAENQYHTQIGGTKYRKIGNQYSLVHGIGYWNSAAEPVNTY